MTLPRTRRLQYETANISSGSSEPAHLVDYCFRQPAEQLQRDCLGDQALVRLKGAVIVVCDGLRPGHPDRPLSRRAAIATATMIGYWRDANARGLRRHRAVANRGQMLRGSRRIARSRSSGLRSRSGTPSAIPACATASGLARSPSLDLGTEPELDPTLPKVEHRLGHVRISLLVLMNRVAVRKTEDLGHALGVDQVLSIDPWHEVERTSLRGSVRGSR